LIASVYNCNDAIRDIYQNKYTLHSISVFVRECFGEWRGLFDRGWIQKQLHDIDLEWMDR